MLPIEDPFAYTAPRHLNFNHVDAIFYEHLLNSWQDTLATDISVCLLLFYFYFFPPLLFFPYLSFAFSFIYLFAVVFILHKPVRTVWIGDGRRFLRIDERQAYRLSAHYRNW